MPGSATSVYTAKRAATLTNPITNDSIFLSADNSAYSAFVSPMLVAASSGVSALEGVPFYLRASGKVTTSVSSTLIVTVYFGTAARTNITYNATGVTALTGALTTGSYATASGNWWMYYELLWDFKSLLLGGSYRTFNQNSTPAVVAETIITAQTAVDLTIPGCGFIVGAHFGSTGAGNIATLSNFELGVL
jgi:hypothetical protein